MTIELLNRLSFKLARTSLLLVVTLGLAVACIQVYLDFLAQKKEINSNILELIQASSSSAQRSVHILDNSLAREVVKGLKTFAFMQEITLYDENSKPMAKAKNPVKTSNTSWLTHIIVGDETVYEQELYHSTDELEGRLVVVINNDEALKPLYKRALNVFVSGLIRNISLALILGLLYHHMLTRPLIRLASNFEDIELNKPNDKRIPHILGHHNDELGHIVNAANTLITNLEARQIDLQQSENQMRVILDASPNQVFAINSAGEFIFLNKATSKFYGYDVNNLVGSSYYETHHKHNANESDTIFLNIKNTEDNAENELTENGLDTEQEMTRHDGSVRSMQITYMPFLLYKQNCVLIIASDITARVQAEERVERLAYFDTLTSLPNRNQINEKLLDDVNYSTEMNTHGAVLFIDIDDFKRINDTMGHAVGDQLLLHISNKMRTQLRKTETLARLGGDEFVLSIPNISTDPGIAQKQAAELASRLLLAIRTPINLESQEISVNASIGIAVYPYSSDNINTLLRFADTAMYEAKRAGRNRFTIFEPKMAENADRALQLENDIRQALYDCQFCFYLQPLIDSETLDLVGAEALIRWQHPTRGQILPDEFISYLESSSLITDVGSLIIEDVCRFIAKNRAAYRLNSDIRISVNISAKELFQNDFVEKIDRVLKRHHLHGECLELEITESVALEGLSQVIEKMRKLQAMGITFSLDDFGTGYSSLNYLKQLPVDKIKIDKSFIKDITIDQQDAALVSSIITIANNLGLNVVAEGVETQEQARWLTQYGKIIFQGYLFNEPLTCDEFSSIYLQENPTPMLPIS